MHNATPGPWRWRINLLHRQAELIGRKGLVMDFVRWGMGNAAPRFRVDGLMEHTKDLTAIIEGEEHHESWHRTLSHPDARLITAAPDLLAACELAQKWLANSVAIVALPDEKPLPVLAAAIANALGTTTDPVPEGAGR
jgi:hypothetical protein